MSEIAISVENIAKKYQIKSGQSISGAKKQEDFWALKNISFEVKKGEILGVIGKNGSGKSTLLKILSRVTKPTRGRITYEGRMGALLEVGTGFHPELSGRENIFLNGMLLGMKKNQIKERLKPIINFADIGDYLEMPVKFYSSGMFVRLAFSVAAHLDTDILLLDEVLSVGDAEFQHKCLNKIDEVNQSKSIVFVSHHMPTITRLTHKTIHLHEGEMVRLGDSRTVTSQYLESDLKIQPQFKRENSRSSPGNHIVRLQSIKVHDESLEVHSFFRLNQKIGISMEYEVLEGGHKLYAGYNFFLEGGVNLFDTHEVGAASHTQIKSRGRYTATVWLPFPLFNTGFVIVGAAMMSPSPFKVHFHHKEVIGFNIINALNAKTTYDYEVNIPGLIRPKVRWEQKKIN